MADKRVIEQTASTELYNDDWFLKDSVVEGTTKISAAKLKELLGADGTQALEEIANAIAEEYDSTHTYTYNSWVFHEGTLYRCIGNNVTGTWNATKWQAKTIKEFIDTAKNSVLGTIEQMFGEYMPFSTLDPPSIEAISKGDIFIYQRTNKYKFYRAKADHPQGVTEFDIDDWDEFDTVSDLIEDVTENAGKVADVQVKTTGDYETVVENKIAKIDLSSITAYGEVPNLPQPIATFKDGADAPMKSLKVAIEPQQDLHGYDAPWVGGAGKNKLPMTPQTGSNTINGITWTINDDGSIKVSGTATTRSLFYYLPAGSYDILNGEYIVSVEGMTEGIGNGFQIGENWNSAFPTFTRTYENATVQQFWIDVAQGTTVNTTIKPMIRLATVSDATFEPYSNICPISGWTGANVTVADAVENPTVSHTYTIDLDGTRYGGEVDVVSGVLTVDRIKTSLPANWTINTESSTYWLITNTRSDAISVENTDTSIRVISDEFKGVSANEMLTKMTIADNINSIALISSQRLFLKVAKADYPTLQDLYNMIQTNNIQVVYELATPLNIQLTPTQVNSLLGTNNVWADTGDINECIYQRDMNTTINDIIARIEALENA